MNPRDRKLRLRKNTVRDLSPQDASQVQGAQVIVPISEGVICSFFGTCTDDIYCLRSRLPECPTFGVECSDGCTASCPCSIPGGDWSQCIAC